MKTLKLTDMQVKMNAIIAGLIEKSGKFPTYAVIAKKAKKNPNSINHYVATFKKVYKIK